MDERLHLPPSLGEDTVATTASARRLLNVNEFRGLFLGQQHLVI
jgi:hypothetical protein